MPLIEYTLEGKVDKVEKAIERIRHYDPLKENAVLKNSEPYYVCYSGGKDSDVLRILFEMSGVKYDLVHNHTTVDAPETVYYIRSIPNIQISMPDITMWDLIVKKRMPPTRLVRYCCSELKERGGMGRVIATGVRWAESVKRQSRGYAESYTSKKESSVKIYTDNDDEESRDLLNACMTAQKWVVNPIIDWQEDDVWEFLNHHNCKSNPLYECGYKRIGCLMCPMAQGKGQLRDAERYPKYKQAYIKAFDRMIEQNEIDGVGYYSEKSRTRYQTGEECFDWWTSTGKQREIDENQMELAM